MKSLKFPLTERPFGGAVELTPKQCKAYHAVTRKIVASTYRKFDAFVREDNRVMDTAKWKPVKTREEVTVYKQLHCKPAEETKPGSQMYETLWRMPKLVAVGTVAGSLDDIMYGIVSPDAASIRIKTSYTHNELLDGAVLREIKTASEKDPFRFLGLKWMAKGHPGVVNAVVRPRDFVFVESTGVNKLKDGTRVGFHVVHSVELPQCPELTSYSIIRARSSSCYLYRQLKPGVVEIYLTSRSDPGGNAPETIAIMSAANTLIGIWKAVWCAQNKKLTWALKNEAARQRCRNARDIDATSHGTASDDQHFCNVCARKAHLRTFRGGSSNAKCRLCSAWVCVPCRVARKLSTVDDTFELRQQVVEVCVRCLASVEMTDSLSVAHRQYVPSADDTIESEKPTQSPIARDTGSVGSDPAEEESDTVGEEGVVKPERVKIETIDDWQCRIMVMGSLPVSSRALTEL